MKNSRRNMKLKKGIRKVLLFAVSSVMLTSFVGCETKTNANDEAVNYEEKYITGSEIIKYESQVSNFTINTEIKVAPEKIPQVEATMYEFNEKVLVRELLEEGIRTKFDGDECLQYSGENGDILNITSDGFYILSEFYNNILYSFHLSTKDTEYNAYKYSKDTDFEFMSREEATNIVVDKLEKCGLNLGGCIAEVYCLDYETLREEEHVLDKDGDASKDKWKDSWTSDDNCYYITIRQTYNDIPEYHLLDEIYYRYEDYCSPIQAIVSKDGIRYLEVSGAMDFENTGEIEEIVSPEEVLDNVINNNYYEDVWEKQEYLLTKMNLCYFSNILYGEVLEIIPVYQLYIEEKYWDGTEWGEKVCQLIIDARTGENIEPYDRTQDIFGK